MGKTVGSREKKYEYIKPRSWFDKYRLIVVIYSRNKSRDWPTTVGVLLYMRGGDAV